MEQEISTSSEEFEDTTDHGVPLVPDLVDKWSFQGVWNDFLTFARDDRKNEPRSHIWASEIGKMNYYERALKMSGKPADIPYEERILRKFVAGDTFEQMILFFMSVMGILQSHGERFEIAETDELLAVSGKADAIVGGKVRSWEEIEADSTAQMFFKFFPAFIVVAKKFYEHFSKMYPNGLPPLIYEIKTVNSQVFWAKKDYLADAYRHHQFQNYTYLRYYQMPEGRVLYISKDDLTMAEFPVYLGNQEMKAEWEEDVRTMTKFIREGVMPPKPDDIVFDKRHKIRFQKNKKKEVIQGCWVPNWEIAWSNYLPTITGFACAEDWEASLKPEIKKRNDAIKEEFINNMEAPMPQ
jgi:hypothetical protein